MGNLFGNNKKNLLGEDEKAHEYVNYLDDTYRQPLCRYVRDYLMIGYSDPIEAEDVVQETFFRAFVHVRNKKAAIKNDWAWLCGVAKYSYYDLLDQKSHFAGRPPWKRIKENSATGDSQKGMASLREEVLSLEQLSAQEELEMYPTTQVDLPAINESIQRLSPEQQQLVDLIVQGYTSVEIAKLLGELPGTIRMRLSRVRRSMREVDE